MRRHFWWITSAFLLFSIVFISWKTENADKINNQPQAVSTPPTGQRLFEQYVNNVYQAANLQQAGLNLNVFQKALTGYINLKMAKKLPENSGVITVVDFSKPSREKRMWIVDLASKTLLLNTWVAHGQGSGDDMANNFSNDNESHQSSLGFYVTDNVYIGKHGQSLRLDGMDEGINSNARSRDIVVHAANYVCQSTINQLGRIGRSFGCPAVAPEVAGLVINTIKGKNMLFINSDKQDYSSRYLNEELAANYLYPDSTANASLATAVPTVN